jgi:hypothetical protein
LGRLVEAWWAAGRERDAYLIQLWKACEPEIKRAVKDLADKEPGAPHWQAWLRVRGLTLDEVRHAAFFAVREAAEKYDPAHESGASFATFAMNYIRGAVSRLAHSSPPLAPVEDSDREEEEELHPEEQPRTLREIVELVHRHPPSKIAQRVYEQSKDVGEHPSAKLLRLADRIEAEFEAELAHDAKLQTLVIMLRAQGTRAEHHEGKMVEVSRLARLLQTRDARRAAGMPAESYSPTVLAREFGEPSAPTIRRWLRDCDAQGITAENWTPEKLAEIVSAKRGKSFRGRIPPYHTP